MPIACQCREVAAAPVVGYQVGGTQSGDGSSFLQQQQRQDPKMRGLPCISIYVKSSPNDNITVSGQKSTDGLTPRLSGGGPEALQALVVQEKQILSEASLQALGFDRSNSDSGPLFDSESKSSSEEGHRKRTAEDPVERLDRFRDANSSSSSSSIGINNSSSLSVKEDASGDMEVESKYKGPLDRMTELEDSLPIKRGLSSFYSGKSKSFACLSDVSCIKDLAKSENPYNKRRRNMHAYSCSWDKNKCYSPRNSSGGISKKGMRTSRSTLALAVAMNQFSDKHQTETDEEEDVPLPPLPPCQAAQQTDFRSPRSFSLTDLQGV